MYGWEIIFCFFPPLFRFIFCLYSVENLVIFFFYSIYWIYLFQYTTIFQSFSNVWMYVEKKGPIHVKYGSLLWYICRVFADWYTKESSPSDRYLWKKQKKKMKRNFPELISIKIKFSSENNWFSECWKKNFVWILLFRLFLFPITYQYRTMSIDLVTMQLSKILYRFDTAHRFSTARLHLYEEIFFLFFFLFDVSHKFYLILYDDREI